MRSGSVAFLLGILALFQLPQLPNPVFFVIAFPLAALAGYLRRFWPLMLFFGFAWSAWLVDDRLNHRLPAELEGQDLRLAGIIDAIPKQRNDLWRFTLRIETPPPAAVDFPKRIQLSWRHPPQALKAGQRWRLTVRLKRPHGFSNPAGFDYEAWMLQQNIGAKGYVRKQPQSEYLGNVSSLMSLRQGLFDALDGDKAKGVEALIPALVLGERQGLETEDWELLRVTGTAHLVAISGLHVGLVAAMAFFLGRWFWVVHPLLPMRFAAQRFAAICALLAALLYAALAGFSLPTQRAVVMVAVVMLMIVLKREVAPSYSLALALFLVLLIDPFSVLSSGFWLSFAAVAVLLWGLVGRADDSNGLWQAQWLVFFGLAPLTLLLFGGVAWLAMPANLIAIPLVAVLVVPLLLLASGLLFIWTDLAYGVFAVAAHLLEAMWQYLLWLQQWSPDWSMPEPSLWAVLLAIPGILWLFAPRGWPGRRSLAFVLFLPLFVPVEQERPAHGQFHLTVLDVGQGLSVLVETAEHVLVYDTGPAFAGGFNTADSVVLPVLRFYGHETVDVLVLSHEDNDHAGGAFVMEKGIDIKRTIAGGRYEKNGEHWQACVAGQQWRWNGVLFRFLAPPQTGGEGNNASCVLKVEGIDKSALLTGDIEAKREYELVGRYPLELAADILIAAHHGSNSSSTNVFLRNVAPKVVVFSNGYRNRYGFPDYRVRQRLQQFSIPWYSTSHDGAVRFEADGVVARRWRYSDRRLWRDYPS